jgi:hypothetical protein
MDEHKLFRLWGGSRGQFCELEEHENVEQAARSWVWKAEHPDRYPGWADNIGGFVVMTEPTEDDAIREGWEETEVRQLAEVGQMRDRLRDLFRAASVSLNKATLEDEKGSDAAARLFLILCQLDTFTIRLRAIMAESGQEL